MDHILANSRLTHRGPDGSGEETLSVTEDLSALFCGHVLHLRGDQMAKQPAKDKHGNLLLWNGEIFDGVEVSEYESDTTVLLNMLSECSEDYDILMLLSRIQGPWSFIYWQVTSSTLWFGRDVFGRRSLLWHLPEGPDDVFALSSVQIKPWVFREVPSVGVFKTTVNEPGSELRITLFPWEHAVWPGTLEPVQNDEDFAARLSTENGPSVNVNFKLSCELQLPSQMPLLNKSLPPTEHFMSPIPDDQSHLSYLKNMLETNSYLKALSKQLTSVLLEAVKTRVKNQHLRWSTGNTDVQTGESQVTQDSVKDGHVSDKHFASHVAQCCPTSGNASCDSHVTSQARVAILFSGGIDSTVIAALADKCVPKDEPIDLLNVAFELKPKQSGKKGRKVDQPSDKRWDVPDRLTGYTALSELNPDRQWNFIEVNVTAEELQEARVSHIQELVYPLQTVLDDSIGCAVWFASRGIGVLANGPFKGTNMQSSARVILCGMGADEQLVGYSRHRVKFMEAGWTGLIEEIELEVTRISARNLGRDDRIITDHGKESRFPFLDEHVVAFLSRLPVHDKADLSLPRGLGEKLLLRLAATELGLNQTATLAKRAIQFGSRIAKLENSKEKASDICTRLLDSNEINTQ